MGTIEKYQDRNFQQNEAAIGRDAIYALRTVHENQTQLVLLADQKANVLIGIVAVILTILCTKANFLASGDRRVLIPLAGALFIELIGVLFALLVLMPNSTHKLRPMRIEDVPNLFFFGLFYRFNVEEYVGHLTQRLNDDYTARRLLATDLYYVGVVLKRKYVLLRYAYIFSLSGAVLLLSFTAMFLFTG